MPKITPKHHITHPIMTAVSCVIPVAHRYTFNHGKSKEDVHKNRAQHKDAYKPFTASYLTTEDYPAVPALLCYL